MCNLRFQVTITHGERGTAFYVVDTSQPKAEQPCIVHSWNTASERNARFLAEDFCLRMNGKETRGGPQCRSRFSTECTGYLDSAAIARRDEVCSVCDRAASRWKDA